MNLNSDLRDHYSNFPVEKIRLKVGLASVEKLKQFLNIPNEFLISSENGFIEHESENCQNYRLWVIIKLKF